MIRNQSYKLLLFTFLLAGYTGLAQELCNNGVDDDSDGLVDLPPIHIVFGARLLHDELVVWRAARVRRRNRAEGPHISEATFLP